MKKYFGTKCRASPPQEELIKEERQCNKDAIRIKVEMKLGLPKWNATILLSLDSHVQLFERHPNG